MPETKQETSTLEARIDNLEKALAAQSEGGFATVGEVLIRAMARFPEGSPFAVIPKEQEPASAADDYARARGTEVLIENAALRKNLARALEMMAKDGMWIIAPEHQTEADHIAAKLRGDEPLAP